MCGYEIYKVKKNVLYFIHLSLEVVNNVVLYMRYWLSVRSRRLDFGQVFFFAIFIYQDEVSHLDRTKLANKRFIVCLLPKRELLLTGQTRKIPSILPVRVAN